MERRKVALIVMALLGQASGLLAQSDFERYVEEIRKAGMSEEAAGSIRMAASILSGATIFEVKLAPNGHLGKSYSSAVCFRPGADEQHLRAAREKIEARVEAWIPFLKKQADTDGSGFVSREEGSALRRRVELGFTAGQVPGAKNVDDLVKAVPEERSQVIEDLIAYKRLQAAAASQGFEGMPALPNYVSGAV